MLWNLNEGLNEGIWGIHCDTVPAARELVRVCFKPDLLKYVNTWMSKHISQAHVKVSRKKRCISLICFLQSGQLLEEMYILSVTMTN